MGTLVALPGGGFAPIEELKVGSRVMTTDAAEVETEVDETWRVAEIDMPNPQAPDDQIRIELARPPEWFETMGAREGRWIWFTLEEMGLEGWARVVRIRGPPEVEDGAGRVVLATVTHLNTELYEVRLSGEGEPIYPTATHRLFSEDRDQWVATHDLIAGERLRTAEVPVIIESIRALSSTHRVFNIEIETEHDYLVSKGRVLSHNVNPCGEAAATNQTGSYTNTHASGKTYSGKGSRARSQQSGRRQARAHDDPHTATDWTPAENTREAFIQESRRIDAQGGIDSPSNYNEVESPGRRFRIEDGEL